MIYANYRQSSVFFLPSLNSLGNEFSRGIFFWVLSSSPAHVAPASPPMKGSHCTVRGSDERAAPPACLPFFQSSKYSPPSKRTSRKRNVNESLDFSTSPTWANHFLCEARDWLYVGGDGAGSLATPLPGRGKDEELQARACGSIYLLLPYCVHVCVCQSLTR